MPYMVHRDTLLFPTVLGHDLKGQRQVCYRYDTSDRRHSIKMFNMVLKTFAS